MRSSCITTLLLSTSISLPLTLASPANPITAAPVPDNPPIWNGPLIFPPEETNLTNIIPQSYRLPGTDLTLVVEPRKRPLGVKDTLLLFIECLFSATRRINAGGQEAIDPVEVLSHKHGYTQIQLIGYHQQITPWKAAEIFQGMATVSAKAGYFDSETVVVQDRVGIIARFWLR
ncbi:MAG: hypothetical protein Q9170_002048 [Blastenia crenularia]